MKKILIVDDDESILEALKIGIESEGYKVVATNQGDETYQKAIDHSPNLILLDLLLSGKDGGEIAKDLKSNKDTKNIPIVMLSAHPNADKLAKESGADGFIAKPFNFDQLINVIESFN